MQASIEFWMLSDLWIHFLSFKIKVLTDVTYSVSLFLLLFCSKWGNIGSQFWVLCNQLWSPLFKFSEINCVLSHFFFQKKDVDNFTKFKKKRWSRCDFEDLTDVIIISTDKKEFHAHKCMLSARLDYFRSMFSMGWIESSSDKKTRLVILKLPIN